jgi:signal transduction histidine kinase
MNNDQLLSILNAVCSPIFVVQEQVIIQANTAALSLMGFPGSSFPGAPLASLVDPQSHEQIPLLFRDSKSRLKLNTPGSAVLATCAAARLDLAGGEVWLITILELAPRPLNALEGRFDAKDQRNFSQALLDTAGTLTRMAALEDVLDRILVDIGNVVDYTGGSMMLVENDTVRIVAFQARGPSAVRTPLGQRFPVASLPVVSRMIATLRPEAIDDTRLSPLWSKLGQAGYVHAYLGAPILLRDEVIGIVNLDSANPYAFSPEDATRLSGFANLAAIAIYTARAFEQGQALAAAEERQRLARELHDAVSQTLFSASMIAESLPMLYETSPDTVMDGLRKLEKLTKGSLAEMRTLLLELRPSAIADSRLETLLTYLINSNQVRIDGEIRLRAEGGIPDVAPNIKTHLYRIVQEALNNVTRHARATRVDVIVQCDRECAALEIRDNGRGFDTARVSGSHMGLRMMVEWAAEAGITIDITSGFGQGTSVRAWWRLSPHE